MDLLYPMAGIVLLVGIPIYLQAVYGLGKIIKAERPDWVAARRSGGIFYTGMPVADPNINLAVIRFALGSEWHCLIAPQVKGYVWRIRLLLPSLLAVFAGVLVAAAVGGP